METGAITEESVKDTSQVSTENLGESQAVTEPNNSDFETDLKEFGDEESISKKAFLDRLSKSKEKRTAAEKKAEAAEAARLLAEERLKNYDWVDNLTEILKNDPDKERKIIEILNAKQAVEEDNDLDPAARELLEVKKELAELKGQVVQNTQQQQSRIYSAYEDDFQGVVGVDKKSLLNTMLKNATATVLDEKFKGWRDRHIPSVVSEAYKQVEKEFDIYLNKQKQGYINNKTNSDSPEIGKGANADEVDKIPYGDDIAMKKYVAKLMTSGG